MSVRIIGNEQEIEWAKEALRNQCNAVSYTHLTLPTKLEV